MTHGHELRWGNGGGKGVQGRGEEREGKKTMVGLFLDRPFTHTHRHLHTNTLSM